MSSSDEGCLPRIGAAPRRRMAGNSGIGRLDSKWIYICVNGRENFEPVKTLVNQRHFRSLESLLSSLTDRLQPPFGAIRNIYTPKNGHRIHAMEQLRNNQHYVVAGFEKFRPVRYDDILAQTMNKVGPHDPLSLLKKRTNDQLHRKGSLPKLYRPAPYLTIFIHRNIANMSEPTQCALASPDCTTMNRLLAAVSRTLSNGQRIPTLIDRIYTPSGVRIRHPDELVNNGHYVALLGNESFRALASKLPNNYTRTYDTLKKGEIADRPGHRTTFTLVDGDTDDTLAMGTQTELDTWEVEEVQPQKAHRINDSSVSLLSKTVATSTDSIPERMERQESFHRTSQMVDFQTQTQRSDESNDNNLAENVNVSVSTSTMIDEEDNARKTLESIRSLHKLEASEEQINISEIRKVENVNNVLSTTSPIRATEQKTNAMSFQDIRPTSEPYHTSNRPIRTAPPATTTFSFPTKTSFEALQDINANRPPDLLSDTDEDQHLSREPIETLLENNRNSFIKQNGSFQELQVIANSNADKEEDYAHNETLGDEIFQENFAPLPEKNNAETMTIVRKNSKNNGSLTVIEQQYNHEEVSNDKQEKKSTKVDAASLVSFIDLEDKDKTVKDPSLESVGVDLAGSPIRTYAYLLTGPKSSYKSDTASYELYISELGVQDDVNTAPPQILCRPGSVNDNRCDSRRNGFGFKPQTYPILEEDTQSESGIGSPFYVKTPPSQESAIVQRRLQESAMDIFHGGRNDTENDLEVHETHDVVVDDDTKNYNIPEESPNEEDQ